MDDALQPYHFHLPPELIAQDPAPRREDSRLLLVAPDGGPRGERSFAELPAVLRAGDLLVWNRSRVLPARLFTRRRDTGGRVELLLVSPEAGTGVWSALARPVRRLRPGLELLLLDGAGEPTGHHLTLQAVREAGQVVVAAAPDPGVLAARHGVMPLPPYIRRDAAAADHRQRAERDRRRYQTVFADPDPDHARSVAAPTAGLHFSDAVLAGLQAAGVASAAVTLHVGPGTFQAPTPDQIRRRRLHREIFQLPADVDRAVRRTRAAGGRVIAVGTTALRVLETVARLDLDPERPPAGEFRLPADDPEPVFAGTAHRHDDAWEVSGATRLFLRPPDRVTAADGLLTNFHLPGSSLLMLVAALAGEGAWRRAYDHAVKEAMRFYSYGDCMLILPEADGDGKDPARETS